MMEAPFEIGDRVKLDPFAIRNTLHWLELWDEDILEKVFTIKSIHYDFEYNGYFVDVYDQVNTICWREKWADRFVLADGQDCVYDPSQQKDEEDDI